MVGGLLAWTASLVIAAPAAGLAAPARPGPTRMEVQDVWRTGDGQFVVVLRTAAPPLRLLPIWVGEGEAVALRMQLDRQSPPRPLTLNLLDQVLARARIRVTDVAIDGYRDGMFLGRVHLRQQSRAWDMEARPADALGLAVARRAPIFVAPAVLARRAVDPRALAPPDDDDDGDGDGDGDGLGLGPDLDLGPEDDDGLGAGDAPDARERRGGPGGGSRAGDDTL